MVAEVAYNQAINGGIAKTSGRDNLKMLREAKKITLGKLSKMADNRRMNIRGIITNSSAFA